jgi:thiol-disulfide isomerase/thioredoxin
VLTALTDESGKHINIANIRGKSLLIDFWATWCGSCIASFPKLEKFQEQFRDRLKILLVTSEGKNIVEGFKKRRSQFLHKALALQIIFDNKTLEQVFPHQGIPHYVWIDQHQIVRAITSSDELTAQNLLALIAGSKLNVKQKDDGQKALFHSIDKPLFINGNGGDGENMVWYSVLSREVPGLQQATSLRLLAKKGMIQIPNTDIYTLYKFAYGNDPEFYEARLPNALIRLNVQDSARYFAHYNDTGLVSGQLYCYNLVTPDISRSDLKKCMQDDLKRYFHLTVKWEYQKVPCLVLKALDTSLIAPVPIERLQLNRHASSPYNFISQNNSLKYFRINLAESFLFDSPFTIIDETNYQGGAFFEIDADMNDWRSINKALWKYKMQLIQENRNMKVLVVTEEPKDAVPD